MLLKICAYLEKETKNCETREKIKKSFEIETKQKKFLLQNGNKT